MFERGGRSIGVDLGAGVWRKDSPESEWQSIEKPFATGGVLIAADFLAQNEALEDCPLANSCSRLITRLDFDWRAWHEPARSKGMSAHKQVVIKLTEEQSSEIREKLEKEVSQIKLWLVPGTVVLAEVIERAERADTV